MGRSGASPRISACLLTPRTGVGGARGAVEAATHRGPHLVRLTWAFFAPLTCCGRHAVESAHARPRSHRALDALERYARAFDAISDEQDARYSARSFVRWVRLETAPRAAEQPRDLPRDEAA